MSARISLVVNLPATFTVSNYLSTCVSVSISFRLRVYGNPSSILSATLTAGMSLGV